MLLANDLPPLFDQLEGFLEDGATTLLSRFSVADIGVCAQLMSLALCGAKIDAARAPKLAHYYAANLARPSFKAATPPLG